MLDHLVYAAGDLAAAVDDLERRTGVRCSPGGQHQGIGTRNALADLGGGGYLEVIGPDPEQPDPPRPRPFGIDGLDAPRLVTWCVRAGDRLDQRVAAARAAGYDPGDVRPLSRRRPDGVLLEWRLSSNAAADPDAAAGGVLPFLIDWAGCPHPSETAAAGMKLVSLVAHHPEPERVRALLDVLGADLQVREGPRPALVAELDTPRGRVRLR